MADPTERLTPEEFEVAMAEWGRDILPVVEVSVPSRARSEAMDLVTLFVTDRRLIGAWIVADPDAFGRSVGKDPRYGVWGAGSAAMAGLLWR